MVSHAARIMHGLPVYVSPSADFVPFFYTPGYPALVAGLGWLIGDVSLPLARSVSLAATCLTFALLFSVIKKEASSLYACIGIGIYAAMFRTNGAFYDLARPDALYLLLVLSGVVLVYRSSTWRGIAMAGVVFTLAFLTKQTSAVFVPPLILFLVWRKWQHALLFGCTCFGLTSLGVWALNHASDGWFWTYIFQGHQGHLFYWKNILLEYWRDVLFLGPVLLLLPLLWFGYRIPVIGLSLILAAHWVYAFIFRAQTLDYVPHMYYRELFYEDPRWLILIPPAVIAFFAIAYRLRNRPRLRLETKGYWLLMYVAGVGASAMNHSTQWAYSNCFMPIALFGALLIPLAVRDLVEALDGPRKWSWLIPAMLVLQFIAWGYSPAQQIPTEADRASLALLKKRTDAVDGKILFPAHPLYSYHRDGGVHIHQMGIQDVAFMGGVKDLRRRLAKKEWAAVIVDDKLRVPGLSKGYYVGERLRYPGQGDLRPKTGFLVRPSVIWYAQDTKARDLVPGITGNFEGASKAGWSETAGDAFGKGTVSRRFVPGRQGSYALLSSRKGTGRYVSKTFTLEKPRLTYLLGVQGRGGGLRVLAGNRQIANRRSPRSKRGRLRRGEINLAAHVGKAIRLELYDDDPAGRLYVDDLRFTD